MKTQLRFLFTALFALVTLTAMADGDLPRVIRAGVPTVGEKYYIASQFNNGGLQYYLSDVDGTVKQLTDIATAGVWEIVPSDTEGFVYLKSQDGRYFDRAGLSTTPVLVRFDATNDATEGLEMTYSIWCQYPGTNNSRYAGYTADGSDRASGWWSTGHTRSAVTNGKTWTTYVKVYNIKGEEVPLEELMAELAENLTAAKAAIALTGVGYPAANSVERLALAAAIEAAENYETFTYSLVTTLHEAYLSFMACNDIELPATGKYYTFKSVNPTAGKDYYLAMNADGTAVVTTANEADAAPFLAISNGDGTTRFVLPNAKYFRHLCHQTTSNQSTTGVTETFDATLNAITLKRQAVDGHQNAVRVVGARGSGNNGSVIIASANGAFNGWGDSECLNANYSTAFVVAEVEAPAAPEVAYETLVDGTTQMSVVGNVAVEVYNADVKLEATTTVEGGSTIVTFNAEAGTLLTIFVSGTAATQLSYTVQEAPVVDAELFTTANAIIAANEDLDAEGYFNFGGTTPSQVTVYGDYLVILNFLGVEGCNLRCDYTYFDGKTYLYNMSLDDAESAAVRTLDDEMGVGGSIVAVGERQFSFGMGMADLNEADGYLLLNMTEQTAEGDVVGYYYAAWGELATAIRNAQAEVGNAAIYNLQGQRISAAQRGINIVGTRKLIVK